MGWLEDIQKGTDEFIGHSQNVFDDTVTHGQNITQDVLIDPVQEVFGSILGTEGVEKLEKEGLFAGGMSFFQDMQGNFMKGGIGNIAGAFGVDPKILLIAGVIAAIIVVVMVIKK